MHAGRRGGAKSRLGTRLGLRLVSLLAGAVADHEARDETPLILKLATKAG